jgi:hypothetical protein
MSITTKFSFECGTTTQQKFIAYKFKKRERERERDSTKGKAPQARARAELKDFLFYLSLISSYLQTRKRIW